MKQKKLQRKVRFTRTARSLFIGLLLLMNTGCSVYMAAHQPKAKDLSVLNPGTPRSQVIAELGAPAWSGEKDGNKADIFTFTQGYSTGAKTARALLHGTADVFSLGLWEVLSTPGEAIFSGTDMKVEVAYDEKDQVKSVRNLGKDSDQKKDASAGPQRNPSAPSGKESK